MSEVKTTYQAGETMQRLVFCECEWPIWTEVIEAGRIFIRIAGVEIEHVSGRCGACGRRLEWHANQVRLERLIERVIKQREESENLSNS